MRQEIIKSIAKVTGLKPEEIHLETPENEEFGDYSSNVAMATFEKSKILNPQQYAETIVEDLGQGKELQDVVDKIQVAGPGFINFFISDNYYRDKLKEIIKKSSDYGKIKADKGKTADIEWVSANPTGPLHAGHGRHIALGKAVGNLLEWSGYKVTREYYYNNAGQQMESLAKSVYARYRQIFEPDYPFPEDGYAGEYIFEIANLLEKEHGDKLIDSDNTLFKQAGENWCFKSIRQTLNRLGITHDIFFNESSLYDSGKIDKTLDEFKKRGLSYEKDGAVWLKTSELLKNKQDAGDKVIVKATGEPTYRLPDMAYHVDKIKRGYDLIVDIFGSDHGDTYKEVLAGVEGLGYDTSKIKVIIHQMVTFVQDGKPVKMSKRSDNVYYLDDLLDDVGVDVAQFFFVMRSANTHLEFDIELAKEQSEKNPVFYLQYAHARISGILRNANDALPDYKKSSASVNYSLLNNAEEISLLKILSVFHDVVSSACSAYEPHKIITYLNEVAENYHKFYHNHRVISTDKKELSYARLKLCEAAQIVLKNGFHIIGISAPERM